MGEKDWSERRWAEGRGRLSLLSLGGAGRKGVEIGQCQGVVVLGCLKGLENRKFKQETCPALQQAMATCLSWGKSHPVQLGALMLAWDKVQQRGRCCFTGHGKLSWSAVATGLAKACFILPLTAPQHGSLHDLVQSFFVSQHSIPSFIHRPSAQESKVMAFDSSWASRIGFASLFIWRRTPRLSKLSSEVTYAHITSLKSPECHWGTLWIQSMVRHRSYLHWLRWAFRPSRRPVTNPVHCSKSLQKRRACASHLRVSKSLYSSAGRAFLLPSTMGSVSPEGWPVCCYCCETLDCSLYPPPLSLFLFNSWVLLLSVVSILVQGSSFAWSVWE